MFFSHDIFQLTCRKCDFVSLTVSSLQINRTRRKSCFWTTVKVKPTFLQMASSISTERITFQRIVWPSPIQKRSVNGFFAASGASCWLENAERVWSSQCLDICCVLLTTASDTAIVHQEPYKLFHLTVRLVASCWWSAARTPHCIWGVDIVKHFHRKTGHIHWWRIKFWEQHASRGTTLASEVRCRIFVGTENEHYVERKHRQ